jgi:hypothetical protein
VEKALEAGGRNIDELSDLPDAGSLFARDPRGSNSRPVQEMRALAEEYDQARSMYKRLTEEGRSDDPRLKPAQATMEKLGQAHAASLGLKKLGAAIRQELGQAEPDRKKIMELERRMTEVAADVLRAIKEAAGRGG